MPNKDGTGPNGQGRGQGQGRRQGGGQCRGQGGAGNGLGRRGQCVGAAGQMRANPDVSWLQQQINDLRGGLERLTERLHAPKSDSAQSSTGKQL